MHGSLHNFLVNTPAVLMEFLGVHQEQIKGFEPPPLRLKTKRSSKRAISASLNLKIKEQLIQNKLRKIISSSFLKSIVKKSNKFSYFFDFLETEFSFLEKTKM